MKIRIKGTTTVYANRKEIKDAVGQFNYKKMLKNRELEYLDENGEIAENVQVKPKNKTSVKVYSSTDDLIF